VTDTGTVTLSSTRPDIHDGDGEWEEWDGTVTLTVG